MKTVATVIEYTITMLVTQRNGGNTEIVKREVICFSRGNVSHARQLKNRLVLLPVKICCYDVGVILNQACSLGY